MSAQTTPAAVVLAGGHSVRLGRDKAMKTMGGIPLLLRVVAALEQVSPDIVVVEARVGSRASLLTGQRVRLVEDWWEGLGPLAGFHAGLSASRSAHAWVLACDLPFLYPPLLTHLMTLAGDHDAVVPVWEGQPHPLCAVYAASCPRAIEETLAGPRRSMRAFLSKVRVRYFTVSEVAELGVPANTFWGINTESDLQRARRALDCGLRDQP